MSLDSLPECMRKCLVAAGKGAGCSSTDVECLCSKDISTSDGSEFMSCVLDGCGTDDMLSASSDLIQLCDQVAGSISSRHPEATSTASSAKPSATSPSTTIATSATDTNVSDSGGSSPNSGGLSAGAGAGIGVGVTVAVILLILSAYLCGRRKRRTRPEPDSAPVSQGEGGAPELASNNEKTTPELEGEKWVPELEGHQGTRPVELEAGIAAMPSTESPAAVQQKSTHNDSTTPHICDTKGSLVDR